MTVESHRKLQEELQQMITVDRPNASKAIEIARAHGDLSENAEYDAAKESQGMLEARIRDLENKLATAQVVDISKLSGTKVLFGATVSLSDMDSDSDRVVSIVGENQADAVRGRISYKSPLARALIGKNEDDVVTVKLPSGEKE
ncbi:UNVERIFIED_CONTAM: hypothetical protein GTU68_047169, partial [Idotea baltica]|nr:hypothetical protein [Idotea baltica]